MNKKTIKILNEFRLTLYDRFIAYMTISETIRTVNLNSLKRGLNNIKSKDPADLDRRDLVTAFFLDKEIKRREQKGTVI